MSFQFFISAEKQQQRHHGHIFKQCEWELALKKLNQKKKKQHLGCVSFFSNSRCSGGSNSHDIKGNFLCVSLVSVVLWVDNDIVGPCYGACCCRVIYSRRIWSSAISSRILYSMSYWSCCGMENCAMTHWLYLEKTFVLYPVSSFIVVWFWKLDFWLQHCNF